MRARSCLQSPYLKHSQHVLAVMAMILDLVGNVESGVSYNNDIP